MSSSSRQTKHEVVAEFRRSQILEAAHARFTRQGVTATTVDDIAREANVAKGTVYLYYRSKDELLRQVVASTLAEWREEALPAIAAEGPVEQRIERFIRTTLGFFDRHREFVDRCQLEMSPDLRRKVRATVGQVLAAQIDAWRDALTAAADDGTVHVSDAESAARGLVTFAHGLAIQRIRGWCAGTTDEITRWATDLVWRGLATR